jgi:hypothetical protein
MAKLKTKNKILLWQVIGVLVTFTPILCEILIHKDTYFATKSAGWSFTIGGVVAVILVAMAMLGKLSKFMGSEIRVMGTIFVLSMLLEPILLNFKLLSFLLLCGMVVNGVVVKPRIRRLIKRRDNEDTAKVLREALHG